MKKFAVTALAFAVALSGVSLGYAADKAKKKTPEEQFKALDKNSDNKVSLEEFVGKKDGDKKAASEKQFKAKDKDSDGSLTLDEFKAPAKKAK